MGRLEAKIHNQINKGTTTYRILYNAFFNKKEITWRTKIKTYKTVLVPIVIDDSVSTDVLK